MIMTAVAFLLGLILCSLFGVPYIDLLKKKMIGQYVKELAPENHAKKQGTPTTGGMFIVAAIIMASVIALSLAQKMTSAFQKDIQQKAIEIQNLRNEIISLKNEKKTFDDKIQQLNTEIKNSNAQYETMKNQFELVQKLPSESFLSKHIVLFTAEL